MNIGDKITKEQLIEAGYRFDGFWSALQIWINGREWLFWYEKWNTIETIIKKKEFRDENR